jgi:GNAT superfamily N-acetyltransferase
VTRPGDRAAGPAFGSLRVTDLDRGNSVRIRPAGPADFAAIRDVEHSTGVRYREVGLGFVADDPNPTDEELAPAAAAGSLWVVEDEADGIVGWAEAHTVDGEGYLHQVSVRPERERAGIGSALVELVVGWAAARGLPALTLTTFRDVPWNRPWYERRGFVVLDDADMGPELAAIRAAERARGLDVAPRVAMRRPIDGR